MKPSRQYYSFIIIITDYFTLFEFGVIFVLNYLFFISSVNIFILM